ncbi:TAP-like protein-domain-containing protein [Microdochium bolleyi]|uniref:TAP-like protein-domain-containing protein n=1 Tax=Microdochium bolleyi TaxID=196109 RepID=A0A136J7U0_9PEZI|nr:TAP-like protein-domain-containing protein [Microdochium bolleyi]
MEHSPLSPHNTEAWMLPVPEEEDKKEEQIQPVVSAHDEPQRYDDEKRHLMLQRHEMLPTPNELNHGTNSTATSAWKPRPLPARVRRVCLVLLVLVAFWAFQPTNLVDPIPSRGGGLPASSSEGSVPHGDASGRDGKVEVSGDMWDQWNDIEPNEKLVWHRCPAGISQAYHCARLTVPMDYHRPLNSVSSSGKKNPEVHIAMVLIPSSDDRNLQDPSSFAESPMLINPGGPGGSGTILAAGGHGTVIRGLVGSKYDVIGFDPRGVGATTPTADCFEVINENRDDDNSISRRNAGLLNRAAWELSGHEIGLINSTDAALGKLNNRARAIGKLCGDVADRDSEDSIFKYSNTPNVARDMLSIIHAWDEWRDSGDSSTSATTEAQQESPAQGAAQSTRDNGGEDAFSTKGKLVYWGFSYGTLLGATFASMFPDKVGRVMLDGVVDADHYVAPVWKDSIRDADAIYEAFYTYCFKAGPSCALFRKEDSSSDEIKRRVEDLLAELQDEPRVILPQSGNGGMPVLLGANDIKQIIFVSLYNPNGLFAFVAAMMNDILNDNMGSFAGGGLGLPSLCSAQSFGFSLNDAQKAVMCSDKRYKLDQTVPDLQKQFEKMAAYSRFADIWIGIMMGCNHWPIEARDPPMRWDDHPAHKQEPIVTSFPVLFLSNSLDPVTPLHAALKMTRKFANASIVEQDAEGHCTIACVSSCTVSHIRAYLLDGVLPPQPRFDGPDEGDWAKCVCESKPWGVAGHVSSGDSDAFVLQDAFGKLDVEGSRRFEAAYHNLHREVLGEVQWSSVNKHNPLREYMMKAGN